MRRTVLTVLGVALLAAACGGDESGSEPLYSGFIVADGGGTNLCDALAESYPPQCGGVIVELADLRLDSVVGLQSPEDPALGAVSWTDYVAGVDGTENEGLLTDVVLTDPVESSASDAMVARVADLGIDSSEPLVLPIDVRNSGDSAITLSFTSGQRVEFTLSDQDGEVYRWSDGLFFSQSLEQVTLEAGAIYGTTLTGEPVGVEPGSYTARAWITAPEANNVVVTWETQVD